MQTNSKIVISGFFAMLGGALAPRDLRWQCAIRNAQLINQGPKSWKINEYLS
jgi:hypothetical protein